MRSEVLNVSREYVVHYLCRSQHYLLSFLHAVKAPAGVQSLLIHLDRSHFRAIGSQSFAEPIQMLREMLVQLKQKLWSRGYSVLSCSWPRHRRNQSGSKADCGYEYDQKHKNLSKFMEDRSDFYPPWLFLLCFGERKEYGKKVHRVEDGKDI